MSGRGRRGDDRDRGGGRRRHRDRDGGGRDRRGGGGRRGDRDHDLELKERDGVGTSPTKDVQFKIIKNVEREKLEQQRQMDQDFPGNFY